MDINQATVTTNGILADSHAAWVDDHADYLFNFAFSRVRDATAAEDIVQETYLSALSGLQSFAGGSTLRTWLTAIIKHKISDHFRLSSRTFDQPGEPLEDDLFDGNGHWLSDAAPTDWGRSPEELLIDTEFNEILRDCIDRLPPNLLTVFRLREIEGLDAQEICEILSITPSNYWVKIHRARLQLRKTVEKGWLCRQSHTA